MASFYTAPIVDGKITTLAAFARKCAPAMFYDCETLPERFESSSYHADEIACCEAELAKYRAMTVEEAAKEVSDRHEKIRAECVKNSEKAANLRISVEKIAAELRLWTPKTEYALALKKYMENQLEVLSENECDVARYDKWIAELGASRMSGAEWISNHLKWESEALVRARKIQAEESKEIAKKNAFLTELNETFPP